MLDGKQIYLHFTASLRYSFKTHFEPNMMSARIKPDIIPVTSVTKDPGTKLKVGRPFSPSGCRLAFRAGVCGEQPSPRRARPSVPWQGRRGGPAVQLVVLPEAAAGGRAPPAGRPDSRARLPAANQVSVLDKSPLWETFTQEFPDPPRLLHFPIRVPRTGCPRRPRPAPRPRGRVPSRETPAGPGSLTSGGSRRGLREAEADGGSPARGACGAPRAPGAPPAGGPALARLRAPGPRAPRARPPSGNAGRPREAARAAGSGAAGALALRSAVSTGRPTRPQVAMPPRQPLVTASSGRATTRGGRQSAPRAGGRGRGRGGDAGRGRGVGQHLER